MQKCRRNTKFIIETLKFIEIFFSTPRDKMNEILQAIKQQNIAPGENELK